MNTPRMVVLGLLVVFVTGCGTIITDVNYDYDSSVDFRRLKTYDWLPQQSAAWETELTMKRVKLEVGEQLASKGFRAASQSPDFVIDLQSSKAVRSTYWSDGGTSTYEEGTLILDFLDGMTGEPIYRATATGLLAYSPSPEQRNRTVNKAVTKMLKDFPPTK